MNSVFQSLQNLGPMRLSALAGVMVGLIAFFIYLTTRLSSPSMALLYGDLEITDSSQIVAQLESMNVPFALRANGRQVMVPADRVLKLRMAMAADGLPSGGSVGYEIFDDTSSLGSSNLVQTLNLVRALEGELSRTIRSLNNVAGVRVHLVLPRRQLFNREQSQSTASIVLKVRGAGRMTAGQVSSIQHLVAAAVPDLSPARVSIVDDRGNLLARGIEAGESALEGGGTTDEMRSGYETRLARKISEMLDRVVGNGKTRVNVSVDMNFDSIVTQSETFDPDGQVARSINSIEETEASSESDGEEPVSVETNLPQAVGLGAGGGTSSNQRSNTSEVINYEISKKVINHVRRPGEIKRISIAVLVDGIYEPAGAGEPPNYAARSPEELEQLGKLVKTAIGYNADRGDLVEIVNMQFAAAEPIADDGFVLPFGFEMHDLLRFAEILVLAVVGILVILLVVRPLINRAMTMPRLQAEAAGAVPPQPLLTDQRVAQPALAGPAAEPQGPSELEQLIDISRVEGRVRASSLKKLGDIVEKHPEEAVAIIRSWMHQEA